MSTIKIREMVITDYEEMYNLWNSTPGVGLSSADELENIKTFLERNPGSSFVAEADNRLIGTVMCGHDGRRGYIYHLTVAEEYRRQGIAHSLIKKSLQRLKELGINKCHLFVFKNNTIGNRFWEGTGWTRRDELYIFSKEVE